ncbi:MAG: GrpB family protein [Chloroflexota bacterium]
MPEALSPIILADWNDAWPATFEAERVLLQDAIGEWAIAIEHVGSTSIPGIAAKPIIDICIAVASTDAQLKCVTPLVELGYDCLGEFGIPGRIYFRKLTDNPLPGQASGSNIGRTHQLHMFLAGHPEFEQHTIFRDYLRAHPDARDEYEQLKRKLAAKHEDIENYAANKTDFVHRILRAAGEERSVEAK